MERSQLRSVVPFTSFCTLKEGVVALDVLTGQFIDQMPHPNVSLVHLPKQISVACLFEEKNKGKSKRKVTEAIYAYSHTIVNGSS